MSALLWKWICATCLSLSVSFCFAVETHHLKQIFLSTVSVQFLSLIATRYSPLQFRAEKEWRYPVTSAKNHPIEGADGRWPPAARYNIVYDLRLWLQTNRLAESLSHIHDPLWSHAAGTEALFGRVVMELLGDFSKTTTVKLSCASTLEEWIFKTLFWGVSY